MGLDALLSEVADICYRRPSDPIVQRLSQMYTEAQTSLYATGPDYWHVQVKKILGELRPSYDEFVAHWNPPQRERLRQGPAVDTPGPAELSRAVVLLRPLTLQQAFGATVASLLPPVRSHRVAPVMPHHGRGMEAQRPAARLQPPAHVHVVACAEVDGIEAADGEQRVAAKCHVAAGHVLGGSVIAGQRGVRDAGETLAVQPAALTADAQLLLSSPPPVQLPAAPTPTHARRPAAPRTPPAATGWWLQGE